MPKVHEFLVLQIGHTLWIDTLAQAAVIKTENYLSKVIKRKDREKYNNKRDKTIVINYRKNNNTDISIHIYIQTSTLNEMFKV